MHFQGRMTGDGSGPLDGKRYMAQRRRNKERYRDTDPMDLLLDDRDDAGRRSRRRRQKKSNRLFAVLALLCLFVLGFMVGTPIVEKYTPTKERKDLNEWFEVAGDQVKIYFNNAGNNEIHAIARDGVAYLPIDWVHDNISDRFFWSPAENMLTYVLPSSVNDYTEDSRDASGHPVFILDEEGDMYLSASFIESMRGDVSSRAFVSNDISAKRVFIYHGLGTVREAEVKRDTSLRVNSGIKAEILTDMHKGDLVTVLDSTENWSRVATADGFIGYCQSKRLSDTYDREDELASWQEPLPTYELLDEKVVMSWHLVTGSAAANAGFDELVANTGGHMNVICPTWIQINGAAGGYDNFSSKEYVDKAHALGIEVWAVVDNFNNAAGFSDFSTKDYFALSTNRRDFISRLMADAELYGYDGFNLDFESLPSDAGESYAQFYRELSVACHERGLTLSIDNYVPYEFNDHYNLSEQGIFADYVVIMGYDEHSASSEEAGSVSSIGYTELGITKALSNVPAGHLINAVPFYTRVWTEAGAIRRVSSRAMGMQAASDYAEENGFEITWDEECGQYYAERTTSSGSLEKIWLEEERSLSLKLDMIKSYGLGGVAGWRLGFEPASVWELLDLNG